MREMSRRIKGRARVSLHGRYGIPMLAMGIMLVLYLIATSPFNYSLLIARQSSSLVIYVIANILIFMILFELTVGMSFMHLKIARGEKALISDLIFAFRNRPDRFILVFLIKDGIFFLCMIPSFITWFMPVTSSNMISLSILSGLLTLVGAIAGLLITVRFSLTEFLMIDNPGLGGIPALKESMRLMKGRNVKLIYLYASFIGYCLLGLLTFNIGFFWIAPYMMTTSACFYLDAIGEPEIIMEANIEH